MRSLKVVVCQINNHNDFHANQTRIALSLQKYTQADNLDIVILPEMALVAYVQTKETVPAEEYAKGRTFEFCRQIALRLSTYVVCGYPEISEGKLYNSAIIVNRQGVAELNIRKKHLFEADKPWALEGQQFQYFDFKNKADKIIRLTIGICMDINPWEFKDNSEFALAQFARDTNSDGIILVACWNDHEPENDDPSGIQNYWLWRLYPIINRKENEYTKRMLVIVADKCGTDPNTLYIGTSSVININPVEVVGYLDKKSESYLFCDLSI